MKLTNLNPKRFFKSKDPSTVSKSGSSFGSSSNSSSVIKTTGEGSVTPTSILPEISTDSSYVDFLKAFKLLDKDNDGAVSRHDLESLLTQLGAVPLNKEEINVMLKEVDREGDGNIRVEELASRVVSLDPESDDGASSELRETFEIFDVDRDGFISAEELLRVFEAIGDERCTLEECRRMIAAVDDDGNGFVCFNEFSKMMMDLHR